MYKYETHAHTSQVSACASVTGAEMARFYKSLGYTGLIITDHFFNGNTTVRDAALPWEQRVELFEAGYLDAKAEGDKIGLDVFFAWEYSWAGNDFLIYGLDREWLMKHPTQLSLKPREYMKLVTESGGLVVHAHPFREAGYIEAIRLIPAETEGVEVVNASRRDSENAAAEWYAKFYGKLRCAGSDNHVGSAQTKLAGVELPCRIESMTDFVEAMRAGVQKIFTADVV